MKFATVLTCMDGRIQIPVHGYLSKRFETGWIDTVTEPGIVKILAEGQPTALLDSIHNRVDISTCGHGSTQIAIVAHADCAGNPTEKGEQFIHLRLAYDRVKDAFPECEVTTLWVTLKGRIEEVPFGHT